MAARFGNNMTSLIRSNPSAKRAMKEMPIPRERCVDVQADE